MKSKFKIVVQGTKLIADYLKKNLEISSILRFLSIGFNMLIPKKIN